MAAQAPPPGTTGLYHFAIRYPDRASLADALRRLEQAGIPLDGASDHGVSEALYLRDPDGNGLELYWDRPRSEWPRDAGGALHMVTERLNLTRLRAEGVAAPAPMSAALDSSHALPAPATPLTEDVRLKLVELRSKLLHLHKVLLDDARVAYETGSRTRRLESRICCSSSSATHGSRGCTPSPGLIVRIDEGVGREAAATMADANALIDQVERLLTASEDGDGFSRRYFEALQRQPAVVLAHADVRRVLKLIRAMRGHAG